MTLAVLYGLLLCIIVFQLGRIFVNHHRLASFQFAFLALCFCWMVLRESLVLLVLVREGDAESLPVKSLLPLLLFPLNLQIATYSLLVTFYAHVVHRARWEDYYKRRVFGTWAASNIFFLVFSIVWLALVLGNPSESLPSNGGLALVMRFLVPAIAFCVLVVLLSYYGYKLRKTLLHHPVALVPLRANGLSVNSITFITVLLCIVFSCRAIYCAVMAYESFYYDYPAGEQPVFGFISLFVSDITPTFAILYFFRHIPRESGAAFDGTNSRLLPPAFQQNVNGGISSPSGALGKRNVVGVDSSVNYFGSSDMFSDDEDEDMGDEEDAVLYADESFTPILTTQQIIASMPRASTTVGSGQAYGVAPFDK